MRAAAGALLVATIALGFPSPAHAQTASVSIASDGLEPATITVPPGTTVTWQNDDDRPHRLTGPGFDTGVMQPFDAFSFSFPNAGELRYGDAGDARYRGRVVVRAGAIAPRPTNPAFGGPGGGGARGAALAAGGASGPGAPLSMGLVVSLVTGIPLLVVVLGWLALGRAARSSRPPFRSNELGPDA